MSVGWNRPRPWGGVAEVPVPGTRSSAALQVPRLVGPVPWHLCARSRVSEVVLRCLVSVCSHCLTSERGSVEEMGLTCALVVVSQHSCHLLQQVRLAALKEARHCAGEREEH